MTNAYKDSVRLPANVPDTIVPWRRAIEDLIKQGVIVRAKPYQLPYGCLLTRASIRLITRQHQRQQTMYILKEIAGDLKNHTIVDLTANAGGDLIGLSGVFGKVVGVEIDPINFMCLAYNVYNVLKLNNVTLYNGDSSLIYKQICDSHKANYIFLDPLWGPDYKSKKIINLELIGKPGQFDALVRHMIRKNKVLIVKAPLNYNRYQFSLYSPYSILVREYPIYQNKYIYYLLLVVSRTHL